MFENLNINLTKKDCTDSNFKAEHDEKHRTSKNLAVLSSIQEGKSPS